MSIKADVEKIVSLARIQLSENEKEAFCDSVGKILESFQKLSEVDTEKIEPMVSPASWSQPLREDSEIKWDKAQQILDQAPEVSGRLFKVPPVV